MSKVCVFLAPGFEECEGLLVVDLLRRAKVEVTTAAVGGQRTVAGSHGIPVGADALAEELDLTGFDLLVLPGGIPGTPNLKASPLVCEALTAQYRAGKRLAAICAAPSVLGSLELLRGRCVTCYPGFEDELLGAVHVSKPVVTDGIITTATGLGTAIPFALELIRLLAGPETAAAVGDAIQYRESL